MENRRGNIHVLMVGDPGLGKSQLLRAASALSTRGVFVCGNTASGSGLTVTMSRDKVGGGESSREDNERVLLGSRSVGSERRRSLLHRRVRQDGKREASPFGSHGAADGVCRQSGHRLHAVVTSVHSGSCESGGRSLRPWQDGGGEHQDARGSSLSFRSGGDKRSLSRRRFC